ncbi:MAG: bifunctional 5,10-methylenetetrahydrofolate dehydrogenase/5,10-methenyltetrahydrofolate cyclohydrolase [Candidatus Aenigmarchaeota archaeon]|nr:bifunctional 5,10-methylenetetrahydrofolate dehydrogenase/5,10-methenyltetrahydrofolate cyclohydrolase [Candidatus Aenigmarchaeota archaeon]
MVVIIDGKKIADEIMEGLKPRIQKLKKKNINPTLAIVLVGDNPSSKIYVTNKQKACEKTGISSNLYEFPENMKEEKLISLIQQLNNDKKIHGIIVQIPLPDHINENKILSLVSPEKDVDGLNPVNVGNLLIGDEHIVPCTPKGIIRMLEKMKIPVEKKNVVIINRSNIVGKPLAMMLTNRSATVTICHSKTKFLSQHTKKAEILITATGIPNMIKKDIVKEGTVIIDAGISYKDGKVYGDVDFENVKDMASYITPVPGGVGPMTVAMVLENTLILAENKK